MNVVSTETITPQQDKKTADVIKEQIWHDGSVIVGTQYNGKLAVIEKEVEIIRDLLPCFGWGFGFMIIHVAYVYSQNAMLVLSIILLYNLLASSYFGIKKNVNKMDLFNLSKTSEKKWMNDKRFNIPLQAFIFLETVSWIWSLIVTSDKVQFNHIWFNPDISTTTKYFAFTMLWGFFTGLSAVCGHELVHAKEPANKAIGTWAYTKFFYTHFLDDHIAGHHKYVGTPEDVGTARKNESIYAFYLRAFYTSHVHTWQREVKRVQKVYGKDVPLPIMLFKNKMVWCMLINFTILSGIYLFFGWQSVKHQFVHAFWGNIYLESINYIEHYGLKRSKDENGIYESISKLHSWNANSSPLFWRLQRHSDHHAHSYRPFQILRRFDDAPFLGFDYVSGLFIAICPPIWFYCINPRVEAIEEFKNGKKREEIDAFDNITPMSDKNRVCLDVGYGWLIIFQILLFTFSFLAM